MKNLIIISILLVFVSTTGCKKKKTEEPKKSRTELLTAHYWKLVAMTVDPPISTISNVYAQMSPCEKDDIVKYNTNNIVTYDEGGTKCNASDPQTETALWTFNSNETIITEDGINENILNLTDDELKMTYVQDISGINYTFTATFGKN